MVGFKAIKVNNTFLTLVVCGGFAIALLLTGLKLSSVSAADPPPTMTLETLKADSLATLNKQDPHAEELVTRATAYADKAKQANPNGAYTARLEAAIRHITYGSSGMGAAQIRSDLELLQAIVIPHEEPTAEDLAPLQERYKHFCAKCDEYAFTKDLDAAFHLHDNLVRFTSLGLFDKDRITLEMDRLEGLVENATDIKPEIAQIYDNRKDKRLVTVPKQAYLGTAFEERTFLTTDRRSSSLVPTPTMELTEFLIQNPDGKLNNFNDCNDPALGIPFSPPITLWAKSRILEGQVPAILLNFVDIDITSSNPRYFHTTTDFKQMADVVEGNLDLYMKENIKLIADDKAPLLLGLCSDFDREVVSNSFGADGRTPYFFILDPKLKGMPEPKRTEEIHRRQAEGIYASSRAISPLLSNQYGDKLIPDGPERVRDGWKRLAKIVTESGGTSISTFCCAGNFHGNRVACKFPGEPKTGNQPWNKLEYYWPGEGVLNWAGINAMGDNPKHDPNGPNILAALDSFIAEVRGSNWRNTPVMLIELSPGRSRMPLDEVAWIEAVFEKVIPVTYSNIQTIFLSVPEVVTLWNPEARSQYRNSARDVYFYSAKCNLSP